MKLKYIFNTEVHHNLLLQNDGNIDASRHIHINLFPSNSIHNFPTRILRFKNRHDSGPSAKTHIHTSISTLSLNTFAKQIRGTTGIIRHPNKPKYYSQVAINFPHSASKYLHIHHSKTFYTFSSSFCLSMRYFM